MKKNKKGFTLIELLAVIVILAILAGITAIMVTNYIENSKINADRLNAQNITNALLREWQVKGNESNKGVYVFADESKSIVNASSLLEKPLNKSPWTDESYTTARAVIDEKGNVRICLYDKKAKKGVIGDYQAIAADEDLKGKDETTEREATADDVKAFGVTEGTKLISLQYRDITKCPNEFDDSRIKSEQNTNPTP